MSSTGKVKIFAGSVSHELGERIANSFGIPLGKATFSVFSDGEFQPSYEESIRGSDVYIVQSTVAPSDNLFELLLMLDAAKRASAKRVTAVIPYFGFARQDRKDKPRVPIGAKLVANLLSVAGVDRVITVDLHADQIQGFFEVPVDHLYASNLILPYIKQLNLADLTMAAPDMGGTKRANAYAKYLGADIVVCYKQRKKANVIDNMFLIGDVKNKNIVLVDDMIDTAGTITKAAELIMDSGALSVRVAATHGIFSGEALERIEKSPLEEVIITDTIPLKIKSSKIKVLSVADLFAEVIRDISNHHSISSKFIY